MKKIVMPLALAWFCFAGGLARADHNEVRISHVLKLSDSECAVELELTADNQDAFTDRDAITLDGRTLITLEGVVDAGINGEGSQNDAGDHILAMSASMAGDATVTVDPDLVFDDEECVNFDNDALFAYVIDGTTVIDTVDASPMTGFGEDETAIERADSDVVILIDLNVESVRLFNNAGDSQSFGEEGPEASTSGDSDDGIFNCALNRSPVVKGFGVVIGSVLIAAFALGILVWRRA